MLPNVNLDDLPMDIPARLNKRYVPNYETFERWARNHRAHQVASIAACHGQRKGQISLPTGTGKTRVQIHLHAASMIEQTKRGESGVYVIASHRLALNAQLLDEMTVVLAEAGIPMDLFFIGSDRYSEDYVYEKFKTLGVQKKTMNVGSGTVGELIEGAYKSAMNSKRHLVCVSTYHSFAALKVLPTIELCTYDEAHTLTNSEFIENIKEVKDNIKRNFFFTATRRVQGEDEGMNRKEFYGELLYDVSPRAMIDAGEIVPPKFHMVRTKDEGDFKNFTMTAKSVMEGFLKHRELVKKHSHNSEKIGAKLLVTTKGNMFIEELRTDAAFFKYAQEHNISVFSFSSEKGYYIDFFEKSRSETVREMKALDDSADAILLHIDILTEGIDLPTITGVMIFRELGDVKLLQTIGRASRLLNEDRRSLYAGKLTPMDYANFIKPYSWIILPEFLSKEENSDALKVFLNTVFNEYEVPVEEMQIIDDFDGIPEEDAKRITRRKKSSHSRDKECDLVHIIKEIAYTKEMTKETREKYLKEVVLD